MDSCAYFLRVTGLFPSSAGIIRPASHHPFNITPSYETLSTPLDRSIRNRGRLFRLSADPRLIHIIPQRGDLGIGGCWNEAIYSSHCGRYTVQLDSDDLSIDDGVLARIVGELERGPYAMVVGSYTIVDVTSCFFDKVFGTLTRRFAAPSPRGRGTFCRRVLLPLGEGGAKRRMRALVAALPRCVFVFSYIRDAESDGP